MTKSLNTVIDLTGSLINSGSLVDPLGSNRSGNFAFTDELRLTGQFPKVFITGKLSDNFDHTFGGDVENQASANIEVYFYTKVSNANIFGDTTGSYKNERLVRHYQKLITDMLKSAENKALYHQEGIHKIRVTGQSDITPFREQALLSGMTSFTVEWRDTQ